MNPSIDKLFNFVEELQSESSTGWSVSVMVLPEIEILVGGEVADC